MTQTLTMLGTLGLQYWVKWKGCGVEKDDMQIFTGDFLFMINVIKTVLFKRTLESIWSVQHYEVFKLHLINFVKLNVLFRIINYECRQNLIPYCIV
jgi:hypothetical protein